MAKNKKRKSLTLILRNYFITGVVVLIPIGFTLYLTKFIISLSSNIIPKNINPNNYLPYADVPKKSVAPNATNVHEDDVREMDKQRVAREQDA